MTIEEMKCRRKELGYSYRELSELSGVPLGTVQKVMGGATASPRYKTLCALEQALYRPANRIHTYVCEDEVYNTGSGKKAGSKAKARTADPESGCFPGYRSEILFGSMYRQPPVSVLDRQLTGSLYELLSACLRNCESSYTVLLSPVLDLSDSRSRTVTLPDLCVTELKGGSRVERITGTPLLVAEFVTAQTSAESIYLKTGRYAAAGVREYWQIDSAREQVEVYRFAQGNGFDRYTFRDVVPVPLPGCTDQIDFAQAASLAKCG